MAKYRFQDLGLVNTKEMFKKANENGYSVPAFNFANLEQLKAILNACHEANSDVILQISESARKYIGRETLPLMIKGAILDLRSKGSTIGVALNLDHGKDFNQIKDCLDYGFSSVMIDASHEEFYKNIEKTKEVVDLAKEYDASVEGELGILSGVEDEISSEENKFTNPKEVVEFVQKTGVDSLAIAIGTAHGAHKFKPGENPKLRLDILEKIREVLGEFPIVLHGSSSVPTEYIEKFRENGGMIKDAIGIPDLELKKASKSIVTKINVDTDGRLVFTSTLLEYMKNNPKEMDLKKYLGEPCKAMESYYSKKIINVFK
ncbi:ketose-bisphosphate aldolase [Candidatus Cetobacterium colombiensis]|uniref:Ketose-bisphosphate aldolase n=1 Tax=Candidatus Cetobacterium colombiensis TaxID=3073100 RepID=A0ABU4WCD6_9FUSO|nr:ketose-bisphosphate aldolase [Candidatus Cetobacterium colombiensis]MDX8337171.1 ketose-bisphosphate aldolase [Candidatus Cetobacterium colombiensis]